MRMKGLIMGAAGAVLALSPAHAQTFNPNFPVCLHVFGPVTYYECAYTSIEQCNLSASGRSAQCVVNPYFAGASYPPAGPSRRYRHHYRY